MKVQVIISRLHKKTGIKAIEGWMEGRKERKSTIKIIGEFERWRKKLSLLLVKYRCIYYKITFFHSFISKV